MNEINGYTKIQIGFHIFIILIACGIIISYTLNDFQVSYVIIGSLIVIGSVYQLYKLVKNTMFTDENIH